MKAAPTDPPRTLTPARLRAVLTVAEEGSFSAAGRRLGISHTAVSQQIREMEAAHGIRLFDRINGALRATPVCRELVEIGQRILSAELDAARVLDRRDSHGKPRLRLGLGNSMPGIAIAGRLLATRPELSISIESGSHQDILSAVLRRDVEVAVLPDVPPDPRFRRVPVLTQEVVAIVALAGPWQGQIVGDAGGPCGIAAGVPLARVIDAKGGGPGVPPRRIGPGTQADRRHPRCGL
jgi:LysR family transcriptional regulator, low CO2-responsive transcriptional regulator